MKWWLTYFHGSLPSEILDQAYFLLGLPEHHKWDLQDNQDPHSVFIAQDDEGDDTVDDDEYGSDDKGDTNQVSRRENLWLSRLASTSLRPPGHLLDS